MAIVVVNHLSLDGVMQSPGRADEDTRGGFVHGGWAASASDPAIGNAMGSVMGEHFSWLFGRRSYEDMLAYWNQAGGPFKDGLNSVMKYVASSNPDAELPWPNSSLLTGDVPAAVAELRLGSPGNLVIMGSGELIRSLLPHDLVDELLLMVHPLTLGSGHRLFPEDGALRRLELVGVEPTESGVVLLRYRPGLSQPGLSADDPDQ